MKHSYTILPEPLQPTADLTIEYFVKRRGVRAGGIRIEEPISKDVPYRSTFIGSTSDKYVLCVEVSESVYTNSLDDFVLTCRDRGLPVKLFISIPKDLKDPSYSQKLKTAKSRGVGIIEIDVNSADVIQEAIPLSLAGVRPIEIEEFPAKLREALTRADTIFRNGSPDKACALVFDEIESICRKTGRKTHDAGFWNRAVAFDFETVAWATLMQSMNAQLNSVRANCPQLSHTLIARIHGVTAHRNESGHKPKDSDALMKRDRELRTRFESAVDLLRDLATAIRPLRIL